LSVREHAAALWSPLTGVPSAGLADFFRFICLPVSRDESSRLDAFQEGRPDRRCLIHLSLG
jgi:hypothetical protein